MSFQAQFWVAFGAALAVLGVVYLALGIVAYGIINLVFGVALCVLWGVFEP